MQEKIGKNLTRFLIFSLFLGIIGYCFKYAKQKMKRIWLFILWLCTVLFAWNLTQAKDYEYTNLDITANILIDGTIDVKEDFTTNFFVSKHWIIRNIPLNYSVWWKDFHIEVSNINVQWKTFKTSKSNWNIEIKIWDANRTLIWEQYYPISYSTYWLIKNFSWMGYSELYWNLVWYEFDTNINEVRAELILPKIYTWFTADDFLITTDWKSKTIDWFDWTVDWSKWDRIIITYDKELSAYHGITLAIKFPNNYFEFDHDRQAGLIKKNIQESYYPNENQYNENKEKSIKQFKSDVKLLIISILWLIIIFWFKIFYKTRNFYGIGDNPLVVQYYPPEWISPSEISFLYNKKITPSCISSMIYKWACEKRIIIKNEKEKFLFFHSNKIRITKWDNTYTNETLQQIHKDPLYEKLCRNYLFYSWDNEVTLPDKWFSKDIIEVNKEIKKYCEDKNLIKQNTVLTTIIRALFIILTPIIWPFSPLIISMFFIYNLETIVNLIKLMINWNILNLYWNINGSLDDYILVFIPLIMILAIYILTSLPKLWNYEKLRVTDKWKQILSEIYWYKKFIESCEEPQLRKFIEEDPDYINKVLPYAVALWLETKLMKVVIPIYQEKWYNLDWYGWDLTTLTSAMSTISSSSHEYHESKSSGSYSSDSWWDSWSSFDSGWSSFDSWWWGGGGWWSSW